MNGSTHSHALRKMVKCVAVPLQRIAACKLRDVPVPVAAPSKS